MVKTKRFYPFVLLIIGVVLVAMVSFLLISCDKKETKSSSGVKRVKVKVETDAGGLTVEQRNIKTRLLMDNEPGAIKHLYIISAYSGQVILYSTVVGKVTSSGKRLTPTTVESTGDTLDSIQVMIEGETYHTPEVLQDDGTYGSSAEYIYWWDTKEIYHQHYISGGQIVHVSSQPIAVKDIIINLETQSAK